MSLETLIPPAGEPVSLAEARTWLRLGSNEGEDAVLSLAIAAARASVEARTGKALVARTVRERFPAARLAAAARQEGGARLAAALHPVTALVAVARTGPAGETSPAPAGLVRIEAGQLWLARPVDQPVTVLMVDYVAGMGAASAIPLADKVAVLNEVAAIIARRDGEQAAAAAPLSTREVGL
jgi:uncharacterized phiE125 gp8 family phage protein